VGEEFSVTERNAESWDAVVGNEPITVTVRYGTGKLEGKPVEIRAAYGRVGNQLQALLSVALQAISIGLQKGVPLDSYVRTLAYRRFAPKQTRGEATEARPTTGDESVPYCTSLIDYVLRAAAARAKEKAA
jgi:hypothetical protein